MKNIFCMMNVNKLSSMPHFDECAMFSICLRGNIFRFIFHFINSSLVSNNMNKCERNVLIKNDNVPTNLTAYKHKSIAITT